MKNLIYILIFLPSLLFSQETKNMEFVGVRNIEFIPDENFDEIEFFVDSANLLKINTIGIGFYSGGGYQISRYDYPNEIRISLDDVLIYEINNNEFRTPNGSLIDFPIMLNSGNHIIKTHIPYLESDGYQYYNHKIILFCQEFKLTTP